ncbi:MAG: glutaredoxin 3 [Gammaproteobacteria bacterium]|nr:glutaredoxin 3 [Gammaproteobacteria bacterium]
MNHIEIYTKSWCPYCHAAKALLNDEGWAFEEIDVTDDGESEQEMVVRSQRRTVPQIFIGDVHVGGFDDLRAFQVSGDLDRIVDTERLEA